MAVGDLISILWSFFFPAYCEGCGKIIPEPGWCSSCLQKLPFLEYQCVRCGVPLLADDHLCGSCLHHPPPFKKVYVSLHYEGLWAAALRRLKFHKAFWLVSPIIKVWKEALKGPIPQGDVVVPIPLHVKRLRQRGFNQSRLLAQELYGKKVVKDLLVRVRYTSSQSKLGVRERLANVRKAFAPHPQALIQGKKIILFDDVMTSGATVKEAAKVLKKAGAREIVVVVMARAG